MTTKKGLVMAMTMAIAVLAAFFATTASPAWADDKPSAVRECAHAVNEAVHECMKDPKSDKCFEAKEKAIDKCLP